MLSTEKSNNKASGIKLVSLYSTIKMMHGPINIRLYRNITEIRLQYLCMFNIVHFFCKIKTDNIDLKMYVIEIF